VIGPIEARQIQNRARLDRVGSYCVELDQVAGSGRFRLRLRINERSSHQARESCKRCLALVQPTQWGAAMRGNDQPRPFLIWSIGGKSDRQCCSLGLMEMEMEMEMEMVMEMAMVIVIVTVIMLLLLSVTLKCLLLQLILPRVNGV